MSEMKPRSLWRRITSPEITVRVMGVVEKYVVYRRKGAVPSLMHVNDWVRVFEPQRDES